MTGYQRAKIVALWIKAKKPMLLDEFATTVDLENMDDPPPYSPKPSDIDIITAIFGDVKVQKVV